jgi:hypothetical protein
MNIVGQSTTGARWGGCHAPLDAAASTKRAKFNWGSDETYREVCQHRRSELRRIARGEPAPTASSAAPQVLAIWRKFVRSPYSFASSRKKVDRQ